MRAIRQLWGDPGEQQWQWVVLFKCEWPEIMSSNGSLFLFLFNLKGHRVFLQVQRLHLPKPARGQGADCQAELCRVPHHCFKGFLDGSFTFAPTYKWGRNMNMSCFSIILLRYYLISDYLSGLTESRSGQCVLGVSTKWRRGNVPEPCSSQMTHPDLAHSKVQHL